MKIKRFFSSDMRNVIRMVREELGPDAVILSNSRVNGGVEVVAAVDYDESIFEQNADKAAATTTANKNDSIAPTMQSRIEPEEDKLTLGGKQKDATSPRAARSESRGQAQDKRKAHTQRVNKPAVTEFDDLSDEQKRKSDFSFYLLDDDAQDTQRINDTMFDTSNVERFADYAESQQQDKGKSATGNSVWSQEPTLVEMRNEISTLRELLEKQLSGLAWGEQARSNPLRAKLLRQLLELDINPPLAGKIADVVTQHIAVAQKSAKQRNEKQQIDYTKAWQHALTLLTREVPTLGDDLITEGGVVALVGPTGVGKTTTVAKLAARYALRHGRNNVALVTTDSFRIAAHEQLRTYGRILGMPVRVAADKDELIDILKGFSDKDLVLIDTAGMSHRDMRLIEQFSLISDCAPAMKSLLVLSTTTHRAGLNEIVQVFRNVQLDGCVLTKTDETTSLAGALSVAIDHQVPVAYVSNGQKVPEDLHLARPHSLVNQSVLIARKSHQSLENESLELAFSRVTSNAYV